jgi:predicted ribosome quality control (RQC) complex YloA/Tae2 family protein
MKGDLITNSMALRQYETSTGIQVLLGKSAETNEELIKQSNKNELLLHTSKPGSPFANIKAKESDLSKQEIYEAAVMCAKHSQDWRDNKKDIPVSVFSVSDVYKTKDMPLGTFGVKKQDNILVKKQDILYFEKKQVGL